jgi:hypothetical protein
MAAAWGDDLWGDRHVQCNRMQCLLALCYAVTFQDDEEREKERERERERAAAAAMKAQLIAQGNSK